MPRHRWRFEAATMGTGGRWRRLPVTIESLRRAGRPGRGTRKAVEYTCWRVNVPTRRVAGACLQALCLSAPYVDFQPRAAPRLIPAQVNQRIAAASTCGVDTGGGTVAELTQALLAAGAHPHPDARRAADAGGAAAEAWRWRDGGCGMAARRLPRATGLSAIRPVVPQLLRRVRRAAPPQGPCCQAPRVDELPDKAGSATAMVGELFRRPLPPPGQAELRVFSCDGRA